MNSPNVSGEDASMVSPGDSIQTPTSLTHLTSFPAKSISVSHRSGSRSRSPTKKLTDLEAAIPPIKVGMVRKAPDSLKVLFNTMYYICSGLGVLPYNVKVTYIFSLSFLQTHPMSSEPILTIKLTDTTRGIRVSRVPQRIFFMSQTLPHRMN